MHFYRPCLHRPDITAWVDQWSQLGPGEPAALLPRVESHSRCRAHALRLSTAGRCAVRVAEALARDELLSVPRADVLAARRIGINSSRCTGAGISSSGGICASVPGASISSTGSGSGTTEAAPCLSGLELGPEA